MAPRYDVDLINTVDAGESPHVVGRQLRHVGPDYRQGRPIDSDGLDGLLQRVHGYENPATTSLQAEI